ncbi:hypothetical protein LSH36_77g01072 [Paralvinella palmiformis]|uniref:STAS domain-containing protein n=1 Tax=Paralvinella palmiformis TaxID=53620 RepID=A0AAD9K3T6_9ANNE|nr:hypothetical protein LSH36_77g01072 [Paralvinella palmiformis]
MEEGRILIDRPSYTNNELIETFDLKQEFPPSTRSRLKSYCSRTCRCTAEAWKRRVLSLLPFIGILRIYKWKKWLLFDFLAGLSVGAIQIPQGMGFSMLTSLPPVYGLYTSVFPVVIYYFLATSRHISMGTMALTSLVIGSVVERELEKRGIVMGDGNRTSTENDSRLAYPQEEYEAIKVDIAMSVSIIAGGFQLLMAVLGLSKISLLMSKSFMGGFLNGAAVQIIGSQMLSLFGLTVKNPPGVFRVPRIVYLVCLHITETNVAALVTGLICIFVLVIMKEVINERCKSRMKMPIPAELLVLVLGTIISHFCHLHERYQMRVIGYIPLGMPPPRVPSFTNAPTYVADAFVVAIISFAISFTMVNMMAQKHNYRVSANQEMFAYGVCHTIGPFLNSFTGCQAPPRTLVHEAVGGQTQVASLFSSLLVFLVFMFLGPLLRSLPVSVLAGIIIVALFPLFKQFKDLKRLWRVSKCDFFTWIITFLVIVIFDITIGLVTGILINMLMLLVQWIIVSGSRLVNVGHSDIYIGEKSALSKWKSEPSGIKVFRFDAPLFYMNVSKFKSGILRQTADCYQLAKAEQKAGQPTKNTGVNGIASVDDLKLNDDVAKSDDIPTDSTHTIVVDCSPISYTDVMGLDLLKTLHKDYRKVGIELVLAAVGPSVLRKLNLAGFVSVRIPYADQCVRNGNADLRGPEDGKENGIVLDDRPNAESGGSGGTNRTDPESISESEKLLSVYPTVYDAVAAVSGNNQFVYRL